MIAFSLHTATVFQQVTLDALLQITKCVITTYNTHKKMLLQYMTGTSKLDIIEMYDSTRDSRKQKHSKVLSI